MILVVEHTHNQDTCDACILAAFFPTGTTTIPPVLPQRQRAVPRPNRPASTAAGAQPGGSADRPPDHEAGEPTPRGSSNANTAGTLNRRNRRTPAGT